MSGRPTAQVRMTRLARRSPSSSVARVALPQIAPCVLDLLCQPRPRTSPAGTSLISP